jgi:hypothetical protein
MTYEENYLAHYGVKGQRWGIRKYQNEDGSLTQLGKEHYSVGSGGNEKFDKSYRKETKKFQKLSDKADIDVQKEQAKIHDERAKKAAKIGVKAGLTAASLIGVGNLAANKLTDLSNRDFRNIMALNSAEKKLFRDYDVYNFSSEVNNIEKVRDSIGRSARSRDDAWKIAEPFALTAVLGASAAAATGLGYAAYNKIAAGVNKHRLTDKGHAKAVAKRDAQYKKITNMVKDTPYAALFADQIAAYKKEHPNTELSDKQIMNNLM